MTKSRNMPEDEYNAIYDRITNLKPITSNGPSGTDIYMFDGEFQPTQNVNEMRWLLTNSRFDGFLFQVDGIGDLILLKPI